MFPTLHSVSSAGPASQAARGSVSPWPSAPATPNVARTCPHLHSKVDKSDIKANNSETMVSVWLRVEILKTSGGEVVDPGLDCAFRCCIQGPRVSQRQSEGHLGRSRPGCTGPVQRNT